MDATEPDKKVYLIFREMHLLSLPPTYTLQPSLWGQFDERLEE